ncbi:FAD/NAD(P)-binding domain-containing protein [Actinomycetospora sp. TBRC 11914]|uniref:FAD/NAD(P)-binding protein n=1 Tax=Actinomycetospora sp. TBRC 11914 TaxID=2729387 RepID=UPI00145CA382|nr:FAD/NAD(P)-binding protein [Actinomycetospora sp. TBRC 11914]NMO91431.1 FAD/NAD(P)-binding protein [Actinomycetospora sp. TBRC 11914]
MARSIVIVGGGPRGTGILERLAASAPEHGVDAEHPLDVHLVDPYPPGAGRIWRTAQSELLWMNSMAADVTMYTDDTVRCTGPVVPGPSLIEWAEQVRDGELPGESVPEGRVGDEVRALRPDTFPTRQLQSHYLDFVLRRVLDTLPEGLRVHVHRGRATDVVDGDVRRVRIDDADGTSIVVDADAVVLASGHLDATPSDDEAAIVETAGRLGLQYFPPEQTTDSDLDAIPAGRTVIARGMGLAFVDLMVLLYEGRGGRFVEDPDGDDDGSGRGRLDYVPSGREVHLQVGSGRGVPYHAKTEYTLRGPRPPLPRFFGPDQVEELLGHGEVSLREDVWPLIAKEVGWGWYHELHHGHPDRVTTTWDDFAERYAALDWYSAEREALVAEAVPAESDRLDFERLDRPLDGVCADLDTLQKHLREYVADDLARHVDPAHTAELGAFTALLSAYMTSGELSSRGGLTQRSRAYDLTWWQNLFSSMASGPPGPRLRQLLALSRAGFVTFLGAGLQVEIDEGAREFVATGASLQGEVRATTFVDARLASASVRRTLDPMLASLVHHGVLDEETLRFEERATPCSLDAVAERVEGRDAPVVVHSTGLVPVRASDFRVLTGPDEQPHPRLFAAGPHTTVRLPGAFTRPRTNSMSFRANDAVAQALLATASDR